jgi:hypothetical protein
MITGIRKRGSDGSSGPAKPTEAADFKFNEMSVFHGASPVLGASAEGPVIRHQNVQNQ